MAEHGNMLTCLSDYFDENAIVKMIEFLLNRSAPPKKALEVLLREGGAETLPLEWVKAHQKRIVKREIPGQLLLPNSDDFDQGFSRLGEFEESSSLPTSTEPDLTCFGRADLRLALIEAKFNAGLTANQPNGYLNSLPVGITAALLFIAPSNRLQSLWTQLRDRAKSSGRKLDDTSGWRIRSVRIRGSDHYMMLVSWTMLMDEMIEHIKAAELSDAECNAQQLKGLIMRKCGATFLEY